MIGLVRGTLACSITPGELTIGLVAAPGELTIGLVAALSACTVTPGELPQAYNCSWRSL